MHMADALLSSPVGGAMYATSACALGWAVKKLDKEPQLERKLPLMAMSGAFVFAAQMINFTIPGTGSSGHLGGGVLLASLLGDAPALLTITAVLIVQCLFFADGGLLALGANIFNMGVIPCLLVWPLIYRPILRQEVTAKRIWAASMLASVVSLQLGAFCVVLETLFSGVTELPFGFFLSLMQPIHLAIGLVEGAVTAGILTYVLQTRPELLTANLSTQIGLNSVSLKPLAVSLAVLAVLVGGGLSLLASSQPDGLEWSIQRITGSAELERSGAVHSQAAAVQKSLAVLPDYDFPSGEGQGTSASGLLGAALTCALAGIMGLAVSFCKKRRSAPPA
ncbi:MAG: energy-coupling factor ABC transporter permease [bacterium]|nr:energy-coupling factor ABC transporter permease [bacterium]